MKATREVNWVSKGEKNVVVKIEKTLEVIDDIIYSDGYNVNLGKKTIKPLDITVYANSRAITSTFYPPSIVTKEETSYGSKIESAGGYARLGDVYIGEENYHKIMVALAEVDAEVSGSKEY